jgi:hypothetical protein
MRRHRCPDGGYEYEPFGAVTQISGIASTDLQFTGLTRRLHHLGYEITLRPAA